MSNPDLPHTASTPFKPSAKKRKSAAKTLATNISSTFRKRPWTYLHLILLGSDAKPVTSVDEITARTHLTSALNQFLGLSGTAIVVDILQVTGHVVYIRVPREDSRAVIEAVSGWIGGGAGHAWRIVGRGEWLGALKHGDGRELFEE